MRAYARAMSLLLLAGVTAYGLYLMFTSDWHAIVSTWGSRWPVILAAFGLGVLDISLECVSWMWIMRRFRIRTWDGVGVKVFLAGYAGVLLPMSLGNLIRPDALKRLGRGSLKAGVKAEAVALFLDATAGLVVIVTLGICLVDVRLAPLAGLAVLAAILAAADRVSNLVSDTPLELPPDFWWRWATVGVVAIRSVCWLLVAFAFYLLIRHLPGDFGFIEVMLSAPLATAVGSGTGLPGGIGAVEGLLGVSLRIMEIPPAHMAFVVGAFRVTTFWVWLPIGWVALLLVNRDAALQAVPRSVTQSVA